MERVSVDLHIGGNSHVSRRDELHVVVNILVLPPVQELALDDTRVLLGRLVDAEGVVSQVERDDNSTVEVLRHTRVEACGEAEHTCRVVHGLEEVAFGLLGHQAEGLALGVFLVAEAVVGRMLAHSLLGRCVELDVSERESGLVALAVEALREVVDTLDFIDSAVGVDTRRGRDLVAGQVVVTNEGMARLVHIDAIGQLLAAEVDSESISTVVGLVALTNLEGVVTEIVVHDEGEILTLGEEAQDLTVVVQELLLAGDFATTKFLLEELEEFRVLLLRLGLLALFEIVTRWRNRRRQITSLLLVEEAGVVIAVVDANLAAVDASVAADAEVVGQEWSAIRLNDAVTLEESTLGHA